MFNFLSCKWITAFTLGSTLLLFVGAELHNFCRHPRRRLADRHSFSGRAGGWTSPALTGSHLMPVRPLEFINDYPGYTVELLQVQWRSGDPIDLYVMKPKGVKKPPVILYLYGYPTDTDIFRNDATRNL